jgi:hypothetical protein
MYVDDNRWDLGTPVIWKNYDYFLEKFLAVQESSSSFSFRSEVFSMRLRRSRKDWYSAKCKMILEWALTLGCYSKSNNAI